MRLPAAAADKKIGSLCLQQQQQQQQQQQKCI
jgi:hypothetical protein